MSALQTLTIFYTYALHGDLMILPKLYTFLQQLKREHDPQALLLDLGASCVPDVWHCDMTGGRSTLVVLDGMGYHAANVSGFLDAAQRANLKRLISTGLVDEQHNWRYAVPPHRDDDIIVTGSPSPALRLNIVAAPADETRLQARTLHLQTIEKGQVGFVRLHIDAGQIEHNDILTLPTRLTPAATISAAAELVEEEARWAKLRREDD